MGIARWLCVAFACRLAAGPVRAEEGGAPEVDRSKSRMSFIDNGVIRLGVDLNVGGAVTWLSEAGGGNLVNSFDWGRQIQMSFYSGPVPFEPNGKQPMPAWRGLGWNPIQAGDAYAHGSKVVELRNEGDKLYIKCIPMQWPLDNEPGECTFECVFELEGNVVKCRYKLDNHRIDETQYEARNQELPAVYANSALCRNFTYVGDEPFTGAPTTEIVHIWRGGHTTEPWAKWESPERWAAMVDKDGNGIGVWSPVATTFNGGNFGKAIGKGGPTDPETNYTGPVRKEILDHNIEYEYGCRLIVGSLEEIRKYVYEKAPRIVSPNYQFKASRDGWYYAKASDSGWPVKEELDVRIGAEQAMVSGPADFWRADEVKKIRIRAALTSDTASCKLLWKTTKNGEFDEAERSRPVRMVGDGKYRVYEIDLSASPAYQGGISQIALKIDSAKPGDRLRIDYVVRAD